MRTRGQTIDGLVPAELHLGLVIVAIVAIMAVPVRRYRTAGPSPVQLVSLLKGGTSGVSEL